MCAVFNCTTFHVKYAEMVLLQLGKFADESRLLGVGDEDFSRYDSDTVRPHCMISDGETI